MKLVLTSPRLLLALLLAGASFSTVESKAAESSLSGSLTQRLRELDTIVNPEEAQEPRVAPQPRARAQQPGRRHEQGLNGASLQPDTSLQSTARGLTAPDEWRQMFPRKEN